MIESVIISLLFAGALFYLGRIAYRSFFSTTCSSGCGKCSTLDVDKLEQQIRMKEGISR